MGDEGPKAAGGEVVLKADDLLVQRQVESGGVHYRFFGRARSSDPNFADRLGELREKMAAEEEQLSLDLAGLEVVNSAFIGLLVGLVSNLDERGRSLTLIGPTQQVKDLLSIVGILDALDIRSG